MSPSTRLKLAVCGSAALMVVLLGSLLALIPNTHVLNVLGPTARLAGAVFLGAALAVNGFLDAILRLRSFRRALGYALLGFLAGALLAYVISGEARLWNLADDLSSLAFGLLISAPLTLPGVIAFTLLWYARLQPDHSSLAGSWQGNHFLLSSLVVPGLVVWGLVTAWCWTVKGIFEPAHYDPDAWEMGAGDVFLLIRGALAFLLAILAALWGLANGTPRARLLRLAIAPGVLILFTVSLSSLDRTSPGFSEARFQQIYEDHEAGRKLSLQEARRRLGEPLFVQKYEDGIGYFYTFTPSGGWGYHKRSLTFDSQGLLTQVTQGDEP
ncbi:MAG: hypothetical protein ACJ76N_27355 [Thermoanaerobaculia bacterium]